MKKQEMTEVLERKLNSAFENSKSTIEHIQRDGSLLQDFITPLGEQSGMQFSANGGVKVHINNNLFKLHNNAVMQVGEKLNINQSYLKQLMDGEDWQKNLASHILNEHAKHSTRQRVLVRVIGDEIRGILSDAYRRLDTGIILNEFCSSIAKQGGRLISAHYDDLQVFVEAIIPELIEVPTLNNGTEIICFGVRFRSSDFGKSALELRSFFWKPICSNGAVWENVMRQIHIGGRLPNNLLLSERTYRLDTRTQASLVRDAVADFFKTDIIAHNAKMIQDASFIEVDIPKELKALPKLGLLQNETIKVEEILLKNNEEDGVSGKPTLWKLMQAISRTGVLAENKTRERELQEISGSLLKRIQN